ncbi:chlorophyll a/b-binding protein [Tychonema sp. LEGE 06208]|uniref:chlorophyll a/b-binding protein n=1 Tax=Tychonema sp. LEGE 06208 TaxID=1828663 RepID=UPI0018807E69|nr:chlorophyll a/b-binding protein [Tychonema sp. LEGE 06208]MBE9165204.1 high light inducible protein [Tychonema sp. LEGE 06208]
MTSRNMMVDDQGLLNNFAIEPTMYVDANVSTGFTKYAEKVNGRFAMIGFVSLLAIEVLTGQGFLTLLKNSLG